MKFNEKVRLLKEKVGNKILFVQNEIKLLT